MARILPASYITALPFIASGSRPRRPAAVVLPAPVGLNQFIALLGPACRTMPADQLKSQAWLSARYIPPASSVTIGATGAPDNICQPVAADHTSPFLPPSPPLHEPPMVNTRPS